MDLHKTDSKYAGRFSITDHSEERLSGLLSGPPWETGGNASGFCSGTGSIFSSEAGLFVLPSAGTPDGKDSFTRLFPDTDSTCLTGAFFPFVKTVPFNFIFR